MANIYELTQDYLRLLEMAEDPELDPEVIADTFEGIEGELEIKAENYAKVMKNLEGDIAALKAEEERLAKKRKAIENNIKRMKGTLQEAMELTGKTKFKTELFSFGIQKNAPSVVIDAADIRDIPKDYLKFKEPEVDKAAIKNAINAGVDFEGLAHLEVSQSLRIR
ncbi:MAG: siphovirus Gp157 family protein [Lachnospiraceae bacterium]|nr:siphovirus Gp157 family protein [Lachnospiraceae bacterium]